MVMWRETILTLTLIATEIFAVKRESEHCFCLYQTGVKLCAGD